MVGGEHCLPLGWAVGVGDGGATSNHLGRGGDGGQSKPAHLNVPASTIVLHTPMPLSLTFTEEKGGNHS